MGTSTARAMAAAAAIAAGLLAGAAVDRWAPVPAAEVARGGEDAFASGLQARELPPGKAPQRWTEPQARFVFERVPPGPARLEVAVQHHRTPVSVTANGALVASIAPGATGGTYSLGVLRLPTLTIELRTSGRLDRLGRRLGTQLVRIRLEHSPSRSPRLGLLAWFALVALLGALLAAVAGLGPGGQATCGAGLSFILAVALLPCGLVRSSYLGQLSWLLAGIAVLATVFARGVSSWMAGAGPWAFRAALAAGIVQVVAATSPLMVTSDGPFHANNLLRVSWGELLLTSLTPHHPPFRFPYGASFYIALLPWLREGADPLALVRWGAAIFGWLGSLGLFLLLGRRSARVAGLAVVILQLLPESFVHYSYGSLSNVFGQSLTVMFLAWWALAAPLGAALGGLLWALGGLAHLSSLVVLAVLSGFLVGTQLRSGML